MRYVSPEGRLVGPEEAFGTGITRTAWLWERAREAMGGGRFWSAALVILLAIAVARSTTAANWVDGIDVITFIAVTGAIVIGGLALSPVREPIALGIGFVLALVAGAWGAWPQAHLHHPNDVPGLPLINVWWERISDGSAASDTAFFLFLICLLMWVAGGWLAWCVLRWRKPMLGLIPGVAAFATNLLNVPQDQNGYTLAMLVLTLALLLWTNYTGSIANAGRANVKLTGDARWDFWESGLVAMAALIVLGIMLPPLSTADRTLDLESGVFSNWAQLQQRLSHPGFFGNGVGGGGVTGFTDEVKLTGPLQRTRDPVFTYTIVGNGYASKARYFRGVNDTITIGGEWRYPENGGNRVTVSKNQVLDYAEQYQKLELAGIDVTMRRPPTGFTDVLFYPGQLYRVDRPTLATEAWPHPSGSFGLFTVDRLGSIQPPTSSGNYAVTVEFSTASVSDLENAGTQYPKWVLPYMPETPVNYRSPAVLDKIHNAALAIVRQAGATNPYDAATAIENYLRDPRNFTYTLTPPRTPDGMDPIDYFLFVSRKGFCEFFATAMGDMLRSLGIPTRLVNGYGPGTFDQTLNSFVVRGEDAHTWVEVYFPAPSPDKLAYGWIPFEPTADDQGFYTPIQRGLTGNNPCLRDDGCDTVVPGLIGGTTTATAKPDRGQQADPGSIGGGGVLRIGAIDASTLTKIVGVIVAIMLLLLAAATRYLRPRTVMSVWKRTLALASLAGADRRPGETPLETGRRLRRAFPEASEPVSQLASGFGVAAYAPPEEASSARPSVMEAWTVLRPMLLRRIFARLRPTRP